jgi:hypothetical protein
MVTTTSAEAPLLGRSNGSSKSAVARYVAMVAAFGACALIVLVLNSQQGTQDALAQSAVKYYYVPRAAVKSNKLPLHLMVLYILTSFVASGYFDGRWRCRSLRAREKQLWNTHWLPPLCRSWMVTHRPHPLLLHPPQMLQLPRAPLCVLSQISRWHNICWLFRFPTNQSVQEKAAPVFTAWDKCKTASDYKAPNADAKRRYLLLSFRAKDPKNE